MIFRRPKPHRPTDARDRRLSIFLWACLISLICGAIEFGQPLEDVIQAGRDSVRDRKAAQDIVVVGLDERTVAEYGGLNFSRDRDAEMLDSLFALGAKRVFFDKVYADPTTRAQDAHFAAALKRHRGKVWLGTMSPRDVTTGGFTEVAPRPQFRKEADVSSLNGRKSPFGFSARLPFNGQLAGKRVRSMSSVLAGVDVETDDFYKPDWSIRALTVPSVSFLDVVRHDVPRDRIAGKDVVVGPTTPAANDFHRILRQGWLPGVYFHVVGAETLKRGMPVNWGWVPSFIVGFFLALAHLYTRRAAVVSLTLVAAVALVGFVPLYLDSRLITVDIVPGALLFTIIAYRAMTLRRVQSSSRTNAISGLPNLAALHYSGEGRTATLIALKMRNFAEIAASFDQSVERAVIVEIRRRIALAGDGGEIFHGEDTLLWFSDLPAGDVLANHLEGLKAILSSAFAVDGREIDLSITFGVDGDHERPIASRIGSAMLCAEEAAVAGEIWKFYDPQRRHEAAWQLSLLSRLDQAIDRGEVWVAYQPQLDLRSGRIVSAEALVRWTHPERGLIGPDEFIALAEKHNRIEKLTAFVLNEAVSAAARINADGADFKIAVNLSVQLLQGPQVLTLVDSVLSKHGLPANKLILEVTETGRLDKSGPAIATMKALSERGIGVAIDDYGTGNATLDYLKILPVDEVKIDRQFVANMDKNEQDQILVRSTIEMVHSLGRRVVAEGVETSAELQALTRLGCDMAQGYLIGRPVPFQAFASLISGQEVRKSA